MFKSEPEHSTSTPLSFLTTILTSQGLWVVLSASGFCERTLSRALLPSLAALWGSLIWLPHGQSPTGGLGGAGVVVVTVTVVVVLVVVVVVVVVGSGKEGGGGGSAGGGAVPFFVSSEFRPSCPAPQHQVPFRMVILVK